VEGAEATCIHDATLSLVRDSGQRDASFVADALSGADLLNFQPRSNPGMNQVAMDTGITTNQ